jgi:hypothetical protein
MLRVLKGNVCWSISEIMKNVFQNIFRKFDLKIMYYLYISERFTLLHLIELGFFSYHRFLWCQQNGFLA